MPNESTGPYAPPDPTNPAARRPLEPGEAEMGAKQLEAWNWAKAQAPSDPGNQQILASQYLYKKYGILPNNGQGDWQNTGGGAHGWKIVNGDLVPNDRSWFEKYGGLAVAIGVLTAGTASAFMAGGGAAAGGAGAATTGPTLEGVAAGAGGATTVPAGAAAAGSTIPAASYGYGGVVTDFSSLAPEVAGGGGVAGLSYGELLRYGLPVAGNLAGNLIQAKASGDASAAQQKYLEEALAYEKEKDAADRQIAANAVTKEAARYGDYQGRIAPFIANGTTSNDRMAALLGLPARAGGGGGYGGGSSAPASQNATVTPEITKALEDNYKALGYTPTGAGSGPTDIDYFAKQAASSLAAGERPLSYWLGPTGRVAQEISQAGLKPSTSAPAGPTLTTQPQARSAEPMVTLRAPDGSTKQVPQSQAAFYQSKGATVVQGAA